MPATNITTDLLRMEEEMEDIWVLIFIWIWDWLKGWVCWRCCLKYIKKINLGQRELFFIWFFWSGTSQMLLLTCQSEDWAWIMALLYKETIIQCTAAGTLFHSGFLFVWFVCRVLFIYFWFCSDFFGESNQFGLGFYVVHSWCNGGVCACRTALTDWYLQSFDELLLPFWRVYACRKFGLK